MKLFIFKRVPDVDVCCQPNKNCHQLNVFISFVKGREGGRGERNFQGSMLVQRHYHGIRLSSGKSPTNFLASFPNSSSAVELRLNGSQFIPGFFFHLIYWFCYPWRSILNIFLSSSSSSAASAIRWFGFYLISFKLASVKFQLSMRLVLCCAIHGERDVGGVKPCGIVR